MLHWEDFTSYTEDEKDPGVISSDAHKLILEVYNSAKGETGDVIFWCERLVPPLISKS